MGDAVDEIIAEPDEPGYLQSVFTSVHLFFTSNGWYILTAALAIYFLWKNKFGPALDSHNAQSQKSAEEIESWQAKEEKRLKAIQKLQEKYAVDAEIRAEKQKVLEEAKKKARLAELEELTKNSSGNKLGDGKSKSFKPEYNPLMGGTSDSSRVCFRRPGGGSGG